MPNNVVRLTKNNVGIADNISERFQSDRESSVRDDGTTIEKVHLGIAIDEESNQIKLVPGSVNGFSFLSVGDSKQLRLNKPSGLRNSALPQGDYLLSDENDLVFTLAT